MLHNDRYAVSNTVSSFFLTWEYLDRDTYIITTGIYLVGNPYRDYAGEGCFYVLRPFGELSRPE